MNKNFILTAMLYLCASCSPKRPQLELSVYNYNFGTVQKDTVYQERSIAKNTGNAPLAIQAISGDCSCTKVSCTKKIICPDDTCLIRFSYRTFGKVGKQENFISIVANTDSIVHILQINAFVAR
jgi:hypothetical protein